MLAVFFRIIPIYYLWITTFIAVVWFAGPVLQTKTRSGILPTLDFTIFQHYLFLQNFRDIEYVTLAIWWFSPTWSLAVEEQFYMITPLVVRYTRTSFLPKLLGVVIIAAPLLRLWVRSLNPGSDAHWAAYRLMPCRADALAIGMLAACAWRSKSFRNQLETRKTWVYAILAALFLCILPFWARYSNPNSAITQIMGYSVLAAFYGVLLIVAISYPSNAIARVLRLRFLRNLGRVSYCMYLIHVAVGYFCFGVLKHDIAHFENWIDAASVCSQSF
jgi:peptidoglycan/LPS O-acetylase OafA/YrhL